MFAVQAQPRLSPIAAPSALSAEERLIKAAQHGDIQAFNQLVLLHQQLLYHTAFHIVGESEAASDATQDAFIAAYKHLRSFRGGSFKAWLLRIVTNTCYNQLRERRRHPAVSLDALLGEGNPLSSQSEPAARGQPQEAAERAELSEVIQRSLQTLPPAQRMTLVLADIDEFAYTDIAQIMNTNVGTVKSRLARARGQLRERLIHSGLIPPLNHTMTAGPS